MKSYISIVLALAFFVVGCKEHIPDTSISGQIQGMGNDTIYLYGMDDDYSRIDTICLNKGRFSHVVSVDTTSYFILLLKDSIEYPVFVDRLDQIAITGSIDSLAFLDVKGNEANELLTNFLREMCGVNPDSVAVLQKHAERFINQHNKSFASLYVFDKFFLQNTATEITTLSRVMKGMSGILLDRLFIKEISDYIADWEKVSVGKNVPYYGYNDKGGNRITRTAEGWLDKYILIHHWASWDELSRADFLKLRRIWRQYKSKKNFRMLGISMDYDSSEMDKVIRSDSLTWQQVSAFKGMAESETSLLGVSQLPSYILMAPSGKVVCHTSCLDSIIPVLRKELLMKK